MVNRTSSPRPGGTKPRPKWSTPRRYSTPEGDRLNVAAIAEKYGIKPKNFVNRQRNGWARLGARPLVAERMQPPPSSRGRKPEDTYLERDVDEVLGHREPTHGRYQLPDGSFALNSQAVMRSLRVTMTALMQWKRRCPHLGGKPFSPLPAKRRSLETGMPENVYSEEDVREVQRALASRGKPPTEPGCDFVSREDLVRRLKISESVLPVWESKGLLHPRETPRRHGRPQIWYPQADYDQLAALLADQKAGRHQGPRGECLSVKAAVERYGWKRETLAGYERECPCLPGGRLVPEWVIDRLSSSNRARKCYHVADLDAIRTARASGFAGYYDTPEGRRLSLTLASKRTGLTLGRLLYYTRQCYLLPEGKLRSVRMRRPNLAIGKKEHTVSEADLDRLTKAIGDAVRQNEGASGWETAGWLCDHRGVLKAKARIQVSRMLQAAHEAGQLSGLKITRRVANGNGQYRTRLHFNVAEVEQLLAGRDLAAVAEEFASNPAGGVGPVVAPAAARTNPAPADSQPFVPSPFQLRILKNLKHRIRTATQLQHDLGCDRKYLYNAGLNPLMAAGKVVNKRGVGGGYCRPDALPPEFTEILGGN